MRLATFNLLNGRSLADGAVDPTRLRAAVQALDADVLGLQEADRDQPRSGGNDQVRAAAEAMGAAWWTFVPAVIGTPGQTWRAATDDGPPGAPAYGIGLVSRLPVAEVRVVRMRRVPVKVPLLVHARQVLLVDDEPRVGIAAVVEAPFGPLTVITTHLSFVPGWWGVQLRTLLHRVRDLPGPKVLLGDLNMLPRPARWLTGWQPLAPGVRTFPSPAPRWQLDHVLGHGPLPAVTQVSSPELPISDHRPLVVDLADRRGPHADPVRGRHPLG